MGNGALAEKRGGEKGNSKKGERASGAGPNHITGRKRVACGNLQTKRTGLNVNGGFDFGAAVRERTVPCRNTSKRKERSEGERKFLLDREKVE